MRNLDNKRAYQREWAKRRRREWLATQKCADCQITENLHIFGLPRSAGVFSGSAERRDRLVSQVTVLCEPCHRLRKKNKVVIYKAPIYKVTRTREVRPQLKLVKPKPEKMLYRCSCGLGFPNAREWSKHHNSFPSGAMRGKHVIAEQPPVVFVPSGLPPMKPKVAEYGDWADFI